VVVAGILVALALNAWWQGRQDASRERAYLREIARDLQATDSSLVRAVEGMERSRRATSGLVRAAYAPAEVPPDSLAWWLFAAQYVSLPTYSTGAADALLETGDLHLIRDDSTRLSVLRMLDHVRESQKQEALLVGLILPILQRQRERTAATNLYADAQRIHPELRVSAYARTLAPDVPEGARLPFSVEYAALLADEAAFRDWRAVSDHLIVLQTIYERALGVVRNARRHVEEALE
jgi:hypothetical protein